MKTKPTKAEIARFYVWGANTLDIEDDDLQVRKWDEKKARKFLNAGVDRWARYERFLVALKALLHPEIDPPWNKR